MPDRYGRRRSVVGPIILISLGLLFLALNFIPDFDPWPVLARYWPLILIFLGLGRIWDYYRRPTAPPVADAAIAVPGTGPAPTSPPEPPRRGISGVGIALILLLLFLVATSWHARRWDDRRPVHFTGEEHTSQSVDLQGAKSVSVRLEMPAGQLSVAGGSSHLLDADFHYDRTETRPQIDYTASGERGELSISQEGRHTHFGNEDNDWDLHFANGVPLDFKLEMGAGQSNISFHDLSVSRLSVEMGAGELNLDLTGPRTTSLDGTIEGGAGQATLRLPKDVGVRISASGGIGSIRAPEMKRDGDAYVNDAYGKTPSQIELTIEGGVGQINLDLEP
jgi:hypothetical protein